MVVSAGREPTAAASYYALERVKYDANTPRGSRHTSIARAASVRSASESVTNTNPPRFAPARRTAGALRIPWRGRAASRRSCRSNVASRRGSSAARTGSRRGLAGGGGGCRGLGGGDDSRGGKEEGGGAWADGNPKGGPVSSSISSSSVGGGECVLVAVLR